VLGILGIIFVGLLLWGGRHLLILLALPLFLPLLLGSRGIWNRIKAAQGPTPGQTSEVETRFLKVTLDHDSGAISGLVREGDYRGFRLEELELGALVDLWRTCRVEDPQSAAVLEAYLDRTASETWREMAGEDTDDHTGKGAEASAMTKEEAREILGVEAGADAQEILEAHRRLMQKIHPDHGGSNYLAAKINQAKDILLKEKTGS
jgi:hypothetical protein